MAPTAAAGEGSEQPDAVPRGEERHGGASDVAEYSRSDGGAAEYTSEDKLSVDS